MTVIAFKPKKKKPTPSEMEAYRRITKGWTAEMKRLICPEYFAWESKQ